MGNLGQTQLVCNRVDFTSAQITNKTSVKADLVCPYGSIAEVAMVTLNSADSKCDDLVKDIEQYLDDPCVDVASSFRPLFNQCKDASTCSDVTLSYNNYMSPFDSLPASCDKKSKPGSS